MPLLHDKKRAEGKGVNAGGIKTAHSFARIADERLAKEIEGSVDENGSRGEFAEFIEQAPEKRIGSFFDEVNADCGAVESKALEPGDGLFQSGERSHEPAIGSAIEELRGALGGNREREGVKVLAVLDVLVDVFDDVL